MGRFDTSRRARRVPFCKARLLAAALAAAVGIGLLGGPALSGVDANDTGLAKEAASDIDIWVSPDRRTLYFMGPIVVGVADRVRAVLDVNPEVATIRLSSPGGRVVEARELGAMIGARQLVTVAAGSCSSACTLAFMAGRERLLATGASIGFHRYHSPDPEQEEAEANMAIDRRYFAARGMPGWFIDQAFRTPNKGMWRPSTDELQSANVITGRLGVDGNLLADTPRQRTVAVDPLTH